MGHHGLPVAAVAACLALLLPACASGKGGAPPADGAAAAQPEAPPEVPPEVSPEEPVPHTDQVPGALERMRTWPGLGDAVTAVVMGSPRGRIHGHDAERIDVEVDDDAGTARVEFVMLPTFELHGDRTVTCVRTGEVWSCQDAS